MGDSAPKDTSSSRRGGALITIGGASVGLQGTQLVVLVGALMGGYSVADDTREQLEAAKEQLGDVEAQLERLEERLASEESARARRLSEDAVLEAEAKVGRTQIEARLAALEDCHRAPRRCPFR